MYEYYLGALPYRRIAFRAGNIDCSNIPRALPWAVLFRSFRAKNDQCKILLGNDLRKKPTPINPQRVDKKDLSVNENKTQRFVRVTLGKGRGGKGSTSQIMSIFILTKLSAISFSWQKENGAKKRASKEITR